MTLPEKAQLMRLNQHQKLQYSNRLVKETKTERLDSALDASKSKLIELITAQFVTNVSS